MRKSKKGLTLVEVLVAISVLTIVIFALFSTIIAMRKVVARQEEYVKIKMVCQDIDAYCDKFGKDWAKYYFNNGKDYTNNKANDIGYLTSNFEPTDDLSKAEYIISYIISFVDNNGEVNLSIKNESKDRVIVSGFKISIKKEEQ